MERRRLGTSDLEISALGLGTWAIGGPWQYGWGHQDDRDSVRSIHAALDGGVDWIDTAPAYGLGHAEEIVGRALAETTNEARVFTKCGIVWDEAGHPSQTLRRASILAEVEASLARLDVETIDLYQIHWPIPDEEIEEACKTLDEVRSQGKILRVGVSNFSVDQLRRAQALTEVVSQQPNYSLVETSVEAEILPYCLDHGIGVINYSPMASGLRTGKMSRERLENLPEDDWRRQAEHFQEPRLGRNLALADLLGEMAAGRGRSTAEMAIAWTLHHPAVSGAIVGIRHPEQATGVLGATEVRFTPEELKTLRDFLEAHP